MIHRIRLGFALNAAVWIFVTPANSVAQAQDTTALSGADVLVLVGGGALAVGPSLLFAADSVTCVPCDRAEVPAFDRWAIAPVRPIPAGISDVLLIGIGVSSWINLANEGAAGRSSIVGSVESALFTEGITELLKRIVARKRPILYTAEGIPEAAWPQNQQSWPSGHAAGAAALATSYWLTRNRISNGGSEDAHAIALAAGAVAVAALRVAAAKHFPTDVLGGLLLGVATAGFVHTVKF